MYSTLSSTLDSDHRTHGLWRKTAHPGFDRESLRGRRTCDVIVVGAGITGLNAALRLAQQGASVIVLESHDVGFGASGRNVGLVNAGLWAMPQKVIELLGRDYGQRLMTLLGEAPRVVFDLIEKHGIDCDVSRAGTLHCAHSKSGLKALAARFEHWGAAGAPVELLDAAQASEAIGSESFHGALLDRRAGTIQPLAYVFGLARVVVASGARIYVASPARALTRNNCRWRVISDEGEVEGDWVIVASNAYGARLRDNIVPFSYFQLSTPPLDETIRRTVLPGGQGAWDTAKVLTSFRFDREGRFIFGSVGRLDPERRGVHARWAVRAAEMLFPQLKPVQFEYGWSGTIGSTRDHLPRFARLHDNVIAAFGYNGRGIAPGTVFGQALADYVTGGDPGALPLPLTRPSGERFRSLRSAGIELGVKAVHWLGYRRYW